MATVLGLLHFEESVSSKKLKNEVLSGEWWFIFVCIFCLVSRSKFFGSGVACFLGLLFLQSDSERGKKSDGSRLRFILIQLPFDREVKHPPNTSDCRWWCRRLFYKSDQFLRVLVRLIEWLPLLININILPSKQGQYWIGTVYFRKRCHE